MMTKVQLKILIDEVLRKHRRLNHPFHFEKAIRQRKCHNCKEPIYKGQPCITLGFNHCNKFRWKKNLCLYCVMEFVLTNNPNSKSYRKLLDEFRVRKVAREL